MIIIEIMVLMCDVISEIDEHVWSILSGSICKAFGSIEVKSKKDFFFKKYLFLHACATYSELSSNI